MIDLFCPFFLRQSRDVLGCPSKKNLDSPTYYRRPPIGSKRRGKSGKITLWGSKTNPTPKVAVGSNNLSNCSFPIPSHKPISFFPYQAFLFPIQARVYVHCTQKTNKRDKVERESMTDVVCCITRAQGLVNDGAKRYARRRG